MTGGRFVLSAFFIYIPFGFMVIDYVYRKGQGRKFLPFLFIFVGMSKQSKIIYTVILLAMLGIAIWKHTVVGGLVGMIIGGALSAPYGAIIGFAAFAYAQYRYCN